MDNVLVVREAGVDPVIPSPGPELVYAFTDQHPADSFVAWLVEEHDGQQRVDVSATCRGFEGGFRLHALNRWVAQAIIRERPDVLVVQGLWGCTADLSRVAGMLGTPSVLYIPQGTALSEPLTGEWLSACLAQFSHVLADADTLASMRELGIAAWPLDSLEQVVTGGLVAAAAQTSFTYGTYEFVLRDHPLLSAMQASEVRHFNGLEHVLDVACGAGIFMDALRAEGHRVTGVEREPRVAAYARGMGLDVVEQDALAYLRGTSGPFDGIYCSHFIEHVPVDLLRELLDLLYRSVRPGGAVVLVFPDPESIRSQLLGFWRDPEHVRFYHPELVGAMATVAGFAVEWTSYQEQSHDVVPFPSTPPALPDVAVPDAPVAAASDETFGGRLLGLLGLQSRRRSATEVERWQAWAQAVEGSLRQQRAALTALEARTDTLWTVNQTWAWNDNATIRLRRREH
jgi:O-antigen chain-terminating methyltransferase